MVAFLVVGALFGFFALGGVPERTESSLFSEGSSGPESSSSVSGLARFFDAVGLALGFSMICDIFFGAAFGAAAFLGAAALGPALAFDLAFCGIIAQHHCPDTGRQRCS